MLAHFSFCFFLFFLSCFAQKFVRENTVNASSFLIDSTFFQVFFAFFLHSKAKIARNVAVIKNPLNAFQWAVSLLSKAQKFSLCIFYYGLMVASNLMLCDDDLKFYYYGYYNRRTSTQTWRQYETKWVTIIGRTRTYTHTYIASHTWYVLY